MPARKVIRPTEETVQSEEVKETPVPVVEQEQSDTPVEVPEEADPSELDDIEPARPVKLEDADPNEVLWENGPTVAETLVFRQEHGDIFVTSLDPEKHFMWKTLDRGEYRFVLRTIEELTNSGQVSQAEASMVQEELICEICFLSPKMTVDDFQTGLAGLPSLIAQQILESSGFVAMDTRGL